MAAENKGTEFPNVFFYCRDIIDSNMFQDVPEFMFFIP